MKRFIMTMAFLIPIVGQASIAQEQPQRDSLAALWTVHIDQVEPKFAKRFEELCHLQSQTRNNILKGHQLPIRPTYEIGTNDFSYLTFRPRTSFADLDQPSTLPQDIRKLLEEKVNSMDNAIHATLRSHHNEIWQLDRDLSYFPARSSSQRGTPGYINIHVDYVKPGKSAIYDSLAKRFHEALVSINYPMRCFVFSVWYGDGSTRFVWEANSREQFQQIGSMERVLLTAYGREEAERMIQQWDGCVVKSSNIDALPRTDLNSLEAVQGWFAPLSTQR